MPAPALTPISLSNVIAPMLTCPAAAMLANPRPSNGPLALILPCALSVVLPFTKALFTPIEPPAIALRLPPLVIAPATVRFPVEAESAVLPFELIDDAALRLRPDATVSAPELVTAPVRLASRAAVMLVAAPEIVAPFTVTSPGAL